jgi:mannose-6-phosphate isomerase-like protein (cupin superfamily)
MKPIHGYYLILPEELQWRPSNLMKIPNADYLERTGSGNLGARLWRLPPKSANTLHKHLRSEEFYFVLEGTGRMRVGEKTLTVPKYAGVLVAPDQLRQVFNDTDEEVLWLIAGAPEELEFSQGSNSKYRLVVVLSGRPDATAKGTRRRGMAVKELSLDALQLELTEIRRGCMHRVNESGRRVRQPKLSDCGSQKSPSKPRPAKMERISLG